MNNPEFNMANRKEQPQVVKLELNVNDLNIVMGALQELPHRIVDQLLKNILAQVQPQLK